MYLGCCPKFLPARQILSKSPSLLAWSPSKAQRRNAGREEGPSALDHKNQARKSQICSGEVSWGPATKSHRDMGTPEEFLKSLVLPPHPGSMQDRLFPAGHHLGLCQCWLPDLMRRHHRAHELWLSRVPFPHEAVVHTSFFTRSLGGCVNAGGYTA